MEDLDKIIDNISKTYSVTETNPEKVKEIGKTLQKLTNQQLLDVFNKIKVIKKDS
uniref:NET domain-containing protein n=1 Tax=viral metagenome TaxID=1070528 RepID=A0A6C0CK83_9ZZZZ